ncbi:MAG: hypothetical protein ACYDA6_05830 [Solirubrobacteraceae bacterium]
MPEPELATQLGPPSASASRARVRASGSVRRATVIGAGSFGTALAVVILRSGVRTTLQARTE